MDCALLPVTDVLTTGVCVPTSSGTADAGDPCVFGETHADKDDCMPGMVCLGYPVSGTSPDCVNDQECAGPIPEFHNPVCVNGKCSGSFCSPRCDEEGLCEPGFNPENVSGICYCIPGEPPGESGPGEPCPTGGVNPDADSCQAGLSCLYFPTSDTSADCTVNEDCDDPIGVQYNPYCVDGKCSGSFCSPPCGPNRECDEGFEDVEVQGLGCQCVPEETTGNSGPGDACPQGSTNPDADRCQSGLTCLAFIIDDTSPDCTIDEDCIEPVGEQYNPDCVESEGKCSASFCAAECGPNDECEADFEPDNVSDTCYCVPAATSRLGEPCPYDTVNATAPQCAPELTCLGVPADGNSGTCPNDVSECTTLTVNVDCVGGNCGASYCAELCGAGDTCPTGYVTHDEGGTCYCIPEG
jgi:hypothetical protein